MMLKPKESIGMSWNPITWHIITVRLYRQPAELIRTDPLQRIYVIVESPDMATSYIGLMVGVWNSRCCMSLIKSFTCDAPSGFFSTSLMFETLYCSMNLGDSRPAWRPAGHVGRQNGRRAGTGVRCCRAGSVRTDEVQRYVLRSKVGIRCRNSDVKGNFGIIHEEIAQTWSMMYKFRRVEHQNLEDSVLCVSLPLLVGFQWHWSIVDCGNNPATVQRRPSDGRLLFDDDRADDNSNLQICVSLPNIHSLHLIIIVRIDVLLLYSFCW